MQNTRMHSEILDLCRLCLCKPEKHPLLDIFSPANERFGLSQKIKKLTNLEIQKNDLKSKLICGDCHELVLKFNKFVEDSNNSQYLVDYVSYKNELENKLMKMMHELEVATKTNDL